MQRYHNSIECIATIVSLTTPSRYSLLFKSRGFGGEVGVTLTLIQRRGSRVLRLLLDYETRTHRYLVKHFISVIFKKLINSSFSTRKLGDPIVITYNYPIAD